MNNAGASPVKEEGVDYNYYARLLLGKHRIRAFQSALQSAVRPGDVVVEIGAGVGTYSFFAAQSGAKRVYAIEKATSDTGRRGPRSQKWSSGKDYVCAR